MANTVINNASPLNPLRVQERLISVMAERDNIFSGMIGTSQDSIIQRITDLEKKAGDTVRFHLGAKLKNEPILGDALLEGSEEALAFFHDTIAIDQLRHAVRLDGKMTEQRSAINLRRRAVQALGSYGRDLMSEMLTYYASGARGTRTGELILPTSWTGFAGNTLRAPDADHHLIAGVGTKVGLTAADKMSTDVLDKAVRRIKLLINTSAAMKAHKVKGKPHFALVITPEQAYDLRQDTKWTEAQQHANVRGEENPLFSGAMGVWNGLVVHENPTGVLFSDYGAGANIPAARAVILGQQALGIAFGNSGGTDAAEGRWRVIEKEDFDFFNQTGWALASILGISKIQFNAKDYGTFTIDTAFTA